MIYNAPPAETTAADTTASVSAFFDTTMKGKLSDSPEDAKVLDMIPATRSIDFGYSYYQVTSPMTYLMDLTNKVKTTTLASTYKKLSASLEKQMNDAAAAIDKLSG